MNAGTMESDFFPTLVANGGLWVVTFPWSAFALAWWGVCDSDLPQRAFADTRYECVGFCWPSPMGTRHVSVKLAPLLESFGLRVPADYGIHAASLRRGGNENDPLVRIEMGIKLGIIDIPGVKTWSKPIPGYRHGIRSDLNPYASGWRWFRDPRISMSAVSHWTHSCQASAAQAGAPLGTSLMLSLPVLVGEVGQFRNDGRESISYVWFYACPACRLVGWDLKVTKRAGRRKA